MNPVLRELITTRTMLGEDGGRIPIDSQITEEEGRHIQRVIAAIKPKTTLEVGMAYGVSTLFICEALVGAGGAKHLVIDPYQNDVPDPSRKNGERPADQGWSGMGLLNVRRAGYERLVEFHGTPSYAALPQILATGQKIDFALIDGMHTFDYALVDFFFIDLLLNIGGVVTFDDLSFPSIRKLCRYILTNRTYTLYQPDASPARERPSFKRRLFERMLELPVAGRNLRRWCKPELLIPDRRLGLPDNDFVSFQKTAEDTIMAEASARYRRWDTHHPF